MMMTERTAHDAGVTACPFVAFVDDRDERADVPDHRHRCYAEIRPAQRAIAHQQTYCLSSAFSACPTFQDWARREAARSRIGSAGGAAGDTSEIIDLDPRAAIDGPGAVVAAGSAAALDDAGDGTDESEPPFDDRAERNPHRDWADPPPWTDPELSSGGPPSDPPPFLATRPDPAKGDEVVAAAGLSASRWLQDVPPPRTPDGAGAPDKDPDDELERALAEDRANRERAAALAGVTAATASSSRAAKRAVPSTPQPKVSQARRTPPGRDVVGPSWERPRRFEAYPTLKTRIGLPSIPRVGLAALAVIVAAVVLFSLPFVFRLGADDQGGGVVASPTGSAAQPSRSTSPTEAPAATAQVYVVKPGDTLLKIAKKYKLTVDQLLAANKKIKNPNKIAVGDEIVIPVPAASDVVDAPSAAPGSDEPASAAP